MFKASFDKANRHRCLRIADRASTKACGSGRRQGRDRPADPHRHPRTVAGRAGGRGRRHPADPGLPLPPDRPAGGGGAHRAGRQRQEGPVPRPEGHAPRRPQARRLGNGTHPADRAGHVLRLQQPGRRHAGPADAPGARLSVVFDVTHSLQLPGAGDGVTAGLASTSSRSPVPASPPASTASSWKSTRSRRGRRRCRQRAAARPAGPARPDAAGGPRGGDRWLTGARPPRPRDRGGGHPRPRRPPRRRLHGRRRARARLPRPRHPDRHGQERHHLPEDRGNAVEHRTPAFFLHPAEAVHGDLGVIQADDVVIAMSYSGERRRNCGGCSRRSSALARGSSPSPATGLDAGAVRRRRPRLSASRRRPVR